MLCYKFCYDPSRGPDRDEHPDQWRLERTPKHKIISVTIIKLNKFRHKDMKFNLNSSYETKYGNKT